MNKVAFINENFFEEIAEPMLKVKNEIFKLYGLFFFFIFSLMQNKYLKF